MDPKTRAGHATLLPRQRDDVFRSQSCLLLPNYYIFIVATPSRHRDLNIYAIFSVPEALLHCRVVVVAKLYNCRVPSFANNCSEACQPAR